MAYHLLCTPCVVSYITTISFPPSQFPVLDSLFPPRNIKRQGKGTNVGSESTVEKHAFGEQRPEDSKESKRKDSDDGGRTGKKDLETLGSGGVVGVLHAGEISVGVVRLDEVDDVVSRSAEGNVVGHATRHARMQDGDELALSIENSRARVTFIREVPVLPATIVEDGNLPGLAREIATGVGLQLRLATKGKIGLLAILRNDEAGFVILVEEVGAREACGVDATQKPELMILGVLEDRWVGGVGIEAGDDLVAGELAGWKKAFSLDEGEEERDGSRTHRGRRSCP